MMEINNTQIQQSQDPPAKQSEENQPNKTQTLVIDRLSTRYDSSVGIVLKSVERTIIEQDVWLGFITSNNKSEYEALIVGLKEAKLPGVLNLIIHCDSQLVVNQLIREYATRNQKMEAYMRHAQKLQVSLH